jgi:hypothetical protein
MIGLILCLLFAAEGKSDATTRVLTTVLLRGEEERLREETALRTKLDDTKRSKPSKQRTSRLNGLQDKIAQVVAEKGKRIPSLSERFDAGDVGLLNAGIKVVQVVDGVNFRGEVFGRDVWVHGFSTTNFSDGEIMRARTLVACSGTKSYPTALGSKKTVPLLESFSCSPEQLKAACVAAFPEPKEQPPENVSPPRMRTWTDVSGKFKVEASFRFLTPEGVRLKKADGSEITIPLEKLSPEDQTLVKPEGKP